MLDNDLFDSDDGTVFRDVIMLALLGFVTIVVLLLPHLNPPVKASETLQPPGNVMVEVRWPDELDSDVDLWVEAPGDRPVGYSNKGGAVFNLLRDDLGHTSDVTQLNYEVAYSRGAPAGEYTINLHLYANKSAQFPIPVAVVVSVKAPDSNETRTLASKNVTLLRVGEELTVVRFALDGRASVIPGSVHQVQRPLRTRRG